MIAKPTRMPEPAPVPLHCRITGAGRPVLLLHGLLGSGSNMGALARHLQERYQILSLDLRNHGRSGQSRVMNYPAMAVDVLHFLERQGVDQCALVGHSMGGKVAMSLASLIPQRVLSLVVVDICPIAYPADRHDDVFDALQNLPLSGISSREQADDQLAQSIPDPGLRQFLLSNLYRQQGAMAWRANLAALRENRLALAAAPEEGESFAGPALFIKGEYSDYISEACTASIQKRFPAAELKIISDAGHWPHAEKPAVFNALLGRFLQRTYPAR